jgi:hypothetical protein
MDFMDTLSFFAIRSDCTHYNAEAIGVVDARHDLLAGNPCGQLDNAIRRRGSIESIPAANMR